jgi:hypothetical protein
VYELTAADPLDGRSWAAWQPWHGDRGFVFAFGQAGGAPSLRLRLHEVRAATSYDVRDVRTGRLLGTFTGAELSGGLRVTLSRWSAAVLSVEPAGT